MNDMSAKMREAQPLRMRASDIRSEGFFGY